MVQSTCKTNAEGVSHITYIYMNYVPLGRKHMLVFYLISNKLLTWNYFQIQLTPTVHSVLTLDALQ